MSQLLEWDEMYENYYMDYGYFRMDYVFDDWEGYHIEVFIDGNEVGSIFPTGDTWTLEDAVEHSKDVIKDYFEDAKRLLSLLEDLDMKSVKEKSQNIKEEYDDWRDEYEN